MFLFVFVGCASIIKEKNTLVTFQGSTNQETEIITPYGSTKLSNGISSMSIPNSKEDINIQIICGKNSPVNAILPTSYSKGSGILGNIGLTLLAFIPGIVGFIIDATGDVAYSPITPFNVNSYCKK